jgi:hypothetical protein
MINVEGQLTFEVVNQTTKQDEQVEVEASQFEVDSEQLDIEDDKRRVAAYLTARCSAFDGDAEFTVRIH